MISGISKTGSYLLKRIGNPVEFKTTVLWNTDVEVNYFHNSGILHMVLRDLVNWTCLPK
jgi:aconitase A